MTSRKRKGEGFVRRRELSKAAQEAGFRCRSACQSWKSRRDVVGCRQMPEQEESFELPEGTVVLD